MFPAQLEDYVAEDNPVRVIDFFVDQLDLGSLALARACEADGKAAHHAAVMLKLYIYATSTAFSLAAGLKENASATSK